MKASGPAAGLDAVADRLVHALGITNRATARALASFGVEPVSALLVTWIPAVELAWIGGLTQAERRRLIGLVHGRHANLPGRAERLLDDWLARRPNDALFRVGRRVLHAQLAALPPAERPALIARVVGPCADLAEVSGGLLGFAAVSADERDWLLTLAGELAVHGSESDNTDSGPAASASSTSGLR